MKSLLRSLVSPLARRLGLGAASALAWPAGIALWALTPSPSSAIEAPPPVNLVGHRRDGLPRKVLIGTVVSGYDAIFKMPLADRLNRMDAWLDSMDAQAKAKYPGKGLDLVVLTEWLLSRPGDTIEQQAVRLEDVRARIEACAQKHQCYLVAPVVLREEGEPAVYSNVTEIVDRQGRIIGVYRKVHPTTDLKYEECEGGITPGKTFPVFDCDFGRLGVQICYDVEYPDGWAALEREGAEIVAFPTETPQSARPSMYALLHRYYVVSATPRDRAAVYNPVGLIDAEATSEGVLVHEIDLSYAISGWQEGLGSTADVKAKFGDRIGFTYYGAEDVGIFWSNDPKTPIGQMITEKNFPEPKDDDARALLLEDKLRGGPPTLP
jgi:predicted amidohydrolase